MTKETCDLFVDLMRQAYQFDLDDYCRYEVVRGDVISSLYIFPTPPGNDYLGLSIVCTVAEIARLLNLIGDITTHNGVVCIHIY